MIYQLTNPLLIPKLLEMAKIVPDTPLDKLEKLLVEAMTAKEARIYVDEKDNEVRGFMLGSIEQMEGEDCVFIQFAVVKPNKNEKHIGRELLQKFKLWAKEKKINYIYIMTNRNIKSFERKYNFKYFTTVLRLDVNKEKKEIPQENILEAVNVGK